MKVILKVFLMWTLIKYQMVTELVYILNSLHQENLVGAVKENSFTTYCAFEKGRNNNTNYRLICRPLLITEEKKSVACRHRKPVDFKII